MEGVRERSERAPAVVCERKRRGGRAAHVSREHVRLGRMRGGAPSGQGSSTPRPKTPSSALTACGKGIEAKPKLKPKPNPKVLYEDAALVAVNKPAGLPCTPAHRLRGNSALSRLRAHLGPG